MLYEQVESELRLYRLTGGKVVTKAGQLPNTTVDLIVTGNASDWSILVMLISDWLTALEDPEICYELLAQERCQPWHRAVTAWAQVRTKLSNLSDWLFLAKLLNLGIHCGSG